MSMQKSSHVTLIKKKKKVAVYSCYKVLPPTPYMDRSSTQTLQSQLWGVKGQK